MITVASGPVIMLEKYQIVVCNARKSCAWVDPLSLLEAFVCTERQDEADTHRSFHYLSTKNQTS